MAYDIYEMFTDCVEKSFVVDIDGGHYDLDLFCEELEKITDQTRKAWIALRILRSDSENNIDIINMIRIMLTETTGLTESFVMCYNNDTTLAVGDLPESTSMIKRGKEHED